MPAPRIRTVMLNELEQHHRTSQQHHLQQRITSALSDISSSGTSESASDLMSEVSDLASLMSINTPDIDVKQKILKSFTDSVFITKYYLEENRELLLSDISIHSDGPLPSSGSDTDSLFSISDFEVEYYMNWERRYHELFNKILTTRVLNPTPYTKIFPAPSSRPLENSQP